MLIMIGDEGYLARRLDQIESEYDREMAAAAQLHGMLAAHIAAHGVNKDDGVVGVEDVPVRPGWEMDVDILPDSDEKPDFNPYREELEKHIGLYFYLVPGTPLAEKIPNCPLNLIACSNGVVDPRTCYFLNADEITSLHTDLALAFGAEPPTPTP